MKKQKGMTFIGMVLTIALIVMAAVVVMRMVPVYIQYYSILQSIKALNSVPASSLTGDPLTDVSFLRTSVSKRLDINGVNDLTRDELIITPDGEKNLK